MSLRYPKPAAEAYRFSLTIGHLLDSAAHAHAEREIVYRDQRRLTYRQFHSRVGKLASVLHTHGVREGATVAVMDWDSHRYLECYFAVPMMGAVLQTVNVRLPPDHIAYTLNHARAETLLLHHDFLPLLKDIRGDLPGIRSVILMTDGDTDFMPDLGTGEYEELLNLAEPFAFKDFDEDAVATIFYTSGTTGNPKGVCFTHRQLVLHTLAACTPSGLTELGGITLDTVYMPLTPMFHVHAWGMPYIATMLGLKQVYPGRYDPDLICALRTHERVTYSHGVPTVLQMVLDAAERTGTSLDGWTMCIGGSALSPALYNAGRCRGMKLVAGYGMSETAPTVAISRPHPGNPTSPEQIDAMTGAGVPIPLVRARIVDEDLRELPMDGVARGELVLRAPWLTPCYVDDEAASQALWRGGWMHTQDIATIGPDGYISICDRLKDVIKTGGEWVASLDIERLIAHVPGIAEATVIGVADARWGERPMAIVVSNAPEAVTLDALNASIKSAIKDGAISRYAQLDRFAIVDALPRTSVGKIDKKALRARFAGFA